jgi:hypothetical protein
MPRGCANGSRSLPRNGSLALGNHTGPTAVSCHDVYALSRRGNAKGSFDFGFTEGDRLVAKSDQPVRRHEFSIVGGTNWSAHERSFRLLNLALSA